MAWWLHKGKNRLSAGARHQGIINFTIWSGGSTLAKLRVLIATFDPPENVGGVEGRARNYTEQLLRKGHFVELVSFSPSYRYSKSSYLGSTMLRFPSSVRAIPFVFKIVTREISKNAIDSIFLLSGGLSFFGILILAYARLNSLGSAVFFYGKDILEARKNYFSSFIPLLFTPFLARRIAANSHFTAGLLPRRFSRKIDILYPAVDPRMVETSRQFRTKKGTVLFVGRLVRRKGVDDLMVAFSKCSAGKDARLEIVGDGPAKEELMKLCEHINIEDRVEFVGQLRGLELYKRYAQCEIFVMVPKTFEKDVEGFGTVFLEAGLFGKPSIGTRSGGIPEAILDGETGILVPEGDIESLERAIGRLFEDPSLGQKMGKEAQNRVLSHFTWEISTDSLVRILEKSRDQAQIRRMNP